MDSGNDFIEAVGFEWFDINHSGALHTGPSNDRIEARGWRGLINSGVIDTDCGNDTIDVYFAVWSDFSLLNDEQGQVSLVDGDDRITLTD